MCFTHQVKTGNVLNLLQGPFLECRYLHILKVREGSNAEVRDVLEGGSWYLGLAPADGAALLSALSAAQRGRAVQVPTV